MSGFKTHSFPLQVKLISLADEAKTIRRIERKLKRAQAVHTYLKPIRESLRDHHKDDVGSEARATNLAYGFLKGRAYTTIEPHRASDPNWASVERMVRVYGGGSVALMKEFETWKAAAGKPDR